MAALALFCAGQALAQEAECDSEVTRQSGGRLCIRIEGDQVGPSDEEIRAERELERRSNAVKRWRFVQGRGRDGELHCWARSPPTFVGAEGDSMYFASMRVMGSWERPQVAIRSERGFDRIPPLFHTKIRDLGIEVGDYPGIGVDRRLGNHVVLAFTPEKSAHIVRELHEARGYRLRLRFWPDDRLHHSPPMSLEGFREAFEKVNDCYE